MGRFRPQGMFSWSSGSQSSTLRSPTAILFISCNASGDRSETFSFVFSWAYSGVSHKYRAICSRMGFCKQSIKGGLLSHPVGGALGWAWKLGCLDGPNRQSPIASVQRTRSTLAGPFRSSTWNQYYTNERQSCDSNRSGGNLASKHKNFQNLHPYHWISEPFFMTIFGRSAP